MSELEKYQEDLKCETKHYNEIMSECSRVSNEEFERLTDLYVNRIKILEEEIKKQKEKEKQKQN